MSDQNKQGVSNLLRGIALRYRRAIVLLVQLALVVAAYVLSFIIRLDLDIAQVPWGLVLVTLPLLIPIRLVTLAVFRLYRGLWRYVSVLDLLQIIRATTVGSAIFVVLEVLIFGLDEFPRSVFVLDWAGNIFLLSGIRLSVRLVRERFRPMLPTLNRDVRKNMLIIGAGDAGVGLCKEALGNKSFQFKPVAFADDDRSKIADTIFGVPIAGGSRDIPRIVREFHVDLAVIAVPSATPLQRRVLVEACQRAKVEFKVLPSTPDIIDGRVSISHIRDVDPVDLLARPPAKLNRELIDKLIRGKRILVTGAAGSVGSELARQVARFEPELLLLIDQAENPLFFLEAEIRSGHPDARLVAQIADVTDQVAIQSIMTEHRPEILLHAAAHKHVPFMERTPAKAVKNNVGGALVVARCAQKARVDKLVMVSTDKAVNPTSVMGATKRLGEILIQEMNLQGPTRFIAVRFGNVLGSNASVVPIFKKQIANGGPVTVTHPKVTRYFMSVHEAVGLILQAAAIGNGGEIVVLEMGDPVPILELAKTLITLSGFRCYDDIDIVFTGKRPGEKLHEELCGQGEELVPTGHEKLFVIQSNNPTSSVLAQVDELLIALPSLDSNAVKARLKQLVPEYQPARH